MTDREIAEWIETLKKGDEVIDRTISFGGSVKYFLTKIKNITPKGMIRVDEGILFDKTGYNCSHRRSHILLPCDETMKEGFKREKIISKINSIDFTNLTTKQLEKIYEIITEK